jgi:hypothetical protein
VLLLIPIKASACMPVSLVAMRNATAAAQWEFEGEPAGTTFRNSGTKIVAITNAAMMGVRISERRGLAICELPELFERRGVAGRKAGGECTHSASSARLRRQCRFPLVVYRRVCPYRVETDRAAHSLLFGGATLWTRRVRNDGAH